MLAGLLILVCTAVTCLYRPALSAGALCFDDDQYLTGNPLVQNPGWTSARRFLTEILKPSTVGGYYQPLAMISLMLDYADGGRPGNLRAFHRTSLVLHVLNTALIVVLLYLLFRQPWAAAMAGLLFGVHPLTADSVVWIAERKTLLAACFSLLSLIAFVCYAESTAERSHAAAGGPQRRQAGRAGPGRHKGVFWYALCWMGYLSALLSKPTSTPLPLLMLLLDYWPLRRLGRRAILEKVPLLVLGLAFAIITFLSQRSAAGVYYVTESSPLRLPLVLCHNIVFYLRLVVWPAGLSAHYPYPEPISILHPRILAGVVGTLLLIPAMWLLYRRAPAVLTGILFFFIAVFPAIGVIGFADTIAANRYTYLPLLGILIIAAWLLGGLWRARSKTSGSLWSGRVMACSLVAALTAAEAMATRQYLALWQDTETLYRHMARQSPRAWAVHYTLGNILMQKGNTQEAITVFEHTLDIRPDSVLSHNNLGLAYSRLNRLEEAAAHYRRAISLQADYAEAHNNLGNILARQARLDEARQEYRQALQLRSTYVEANLNLANVLAMQGLFDEAIAQLRRGVESSPDQPVLHCNLANLLATSARYEEAVQHYQQALRLRPDYAEARSKLDMVLAEQQRQSQAPPAPEVPMPRP